MERSVVVRVRRSDLVFEADIMGPQGFQEMSVQDLAVFKQLCYTLPPIGTYEIAVGICKGHADLNHIYDAFTSGIGVYVGGVKAKIKAGESFGMLFCPEKHLCGNRLKDCSFYIVAWKAYKITEIE